MPRLEPRIVGGVLLIAAGVLFLLQSLGFITQGVDVLLAVLMGVGGLFFMALFLLGPAQRWWAAIPGIILLDLTALTALELLFPGLGCSVPVGGLVLSCSNLAGAGFLAGIGLSFWVVYAANRNQWWAVIPGGVLLTLAAVAAVGSAGQGTATGGLFFLGLAATFMLVGVLPAPHGRMGWAFIPAGIFGVLGLALLLSRTALINYAWALALIGVGLFLFIRALRR